MTTNKNLFLFLLFVGLLSSCSIEKRVHSNGYHMDWNTNSSRLQQKELTLTKKHKTFNRFELNGQDHQDNTKPISSLNGGALKTAENKPKTVKTTINDLIDFAKTTKIKTRGEIKPNTIEQDAKTDTEAKYVPAAVFSFILALGGPLLMIASFTTLGIILSVLGFILGIIALNKIAKDPLLKGMSLALFGLVFPLFILLLVYAFSGLNGIE
jgi:ribosomal protein L17